MSSLLQIENEYGPVEWEIGAEGKAYTKWAGQMAVGLKTGVPWIMCKQEDAPDPIVSLSVSFVPARALLTGSIGSIWEKLSVSSHCFTMFEVSVSTFIVPKNLLNTC